MKQKNLNLFYIIIIIKHLKSNIISKTKIITHKRKVTQFNYYCIKNKTLLLCLKKKMIKKVIIISFDLFFEYIYI